MMGALPPYFPTLPQEHGELKKALPEYNASLANTKGRDKVNVLSEVEGLCEVEGLLTKALSASWRMGLFFCLKFDDVTI